MNLKNKDDAEMAFQRVEAWFKGQIIDRPPIRFTGHNAEYSNTDAECTPRQWKEFWFDTERVVNSFTKSSANKIFLAETFPVFWPNLGPDVYASFYGCDLTFDEITSWSHPCIETLQDISVVHCAPEGSEYYKKLTQLTQCALENCDGRYIVGYPDFHPGVDCVAAWRGPENLCFDLMENPDIVGRLVTLASKDFIAIYDHFDSLLKQYGQPSTNWMGIPAAGKFHVPSCDFATMMSPQQFRHFALPVIQKEIAHATHNVFHLDGKGVARHLNDILELPEISAIQWVQGAGDDEPIMQWIPLIKEIRNAGKNVVLGIKEHELDEFIDEIPPEGIFLCIEENDQAIQQAIIKRIQNWVS